MKSKTLILGLLSISALIFASIACGISAPPTVSTLEPTLTTFPPTATQTPRPSSTPRPTWTPNVAATQHAEELMAEIQMYYEKGYLSTNTGTFAELSDFAYEAATLGSYKFLRLPVSASDFLLSGHFKWNSALRNSGTAGCGFIFGLQPNDDHYAVFLDRTQVYFRIRNPQLGYSSTVEPTRMRGTVKFDYPAEADFTLIIKGKYAYVLVNGDVINEYTLLDGRPLRGNLGLAVLSGTNKDYGTRCEMTNLRLWLPDE